MGVLDFVPEYIVSSLSTIAIMGDSPYDFCEKLMWFFRSFGCPFDGLFHSLNVGGEKESCCLFWLSANYFKLKNNEDSNDKGTDQIIVDDNPIDEFLFRKLATVTITALLSIVYPWMTVLIVYLTPPVGNYCRSKYVTVICSIWSFNSALAYIYHIKGESDLIMSEESDLIVSVKTGKWKSIRKFVEKWKRMRKLHKWFSICEKTQTYDNCRQLDQSGLLIILDMRLPGF
ncbi:11016_t:CDS:2 [Funneliformis mosseae]|uniref:11016_t:CDS:1 n=1 Tax=Funneliformis mosseae TaxID=27381 RepID=A0A9N9FTV0_FUNMO|nr:11016_t:CDS:2 [Funneliformis mosseae]